jgi:hypothetical protein
MFEVVLQSLLNMSLHDVFSLILIELHTNQIEVYDWENEPLKIHVP